jgi:hypothetical protein
MRDLSFVNLSCRYIQIRLYKVNFLETAEEPSKIVVIASPPSDKGVSSKLLVLAGLGEIFPSSMAKGLSGWHVHISAFDDHLTILYSPNAIEKIVSWISGDSKTTVSLRLALTLISSISAISLLVSLPLAFVGRLEVKNLSEKFISAKFLLILILFAPISFIFLTLFTNVLRAPIASFILGIFYSQALGLLIYRRDLSQVKGIFGEMKPSSLGSAILLALFAYLMMHHALQPFLNVEPSVFRLPPIIELSFLLICPNIRDPYPEELWGYTSKFPSKAHFNVSELHDSFINTSDTRGRRICRLLPHSDLHEPHIAHPHRAPSLSSSFERISSQSHLDIGGAGPPTWSGDSDNLTNEAEFAVSCLVLTSFASKFPISAEQLLRDA